MAPDAPGTADSFDHESDPNFLRYYEEASLSDDTHRRFRSLRDKAIGLLARTGTDVRRLRMADIGCGAGTQAFVWAELGHEAAGLDVNRPLVEVARKRAAERGVSATFDVGSATDLPYPDQSFDACMLPGLLEHVEDWQSCLREAVRVLRPGGLLYLTTTNALCPMQEEFNLPAYSWYPGFLKRRYERLAVTTRPDLANHAKYPAVHWFTFYGLESFLRGLGMRCYDRFDLIDTTGRNPLVKLAVGACRRLPPARFASRVLMEGTIVFGIRERG